MHSKGRLLALPRFAWVYITYVAFLLEKTWFNNHVRLSGHTSDSAMLTTPSPKSRIPSGPYASPDPLLSVSSPSFICSLTSPTSLGRLRRRLPVPDDSSLRYYSGMFMGLVRNGLCLFSLRFLRSGTYWVWYSRRDESTKNLEEKGFFRSVNSGDPIDHSMHPFLVLGFVSFLRRF